MRVLLFLAVFVSLSFGVVQAADNSVAVTHSMAVTVPVFTRHFPHANSANEHNYGVGLEYLVRKNVSLTAGIFNNSLRKNTCYVGMIYTPFYVAGLHTGIIIGLDVSGGYNSINPWKPIIGTLHFTTGNESPIGLNIDVLPGGKNKDSTTYMYGAVAVSMKYSF